MQLYYAVHNANSIYLAYFIKYGFCCLKLSGALGSNHVEPPLSTLKNILDTINVIEKFIFTSDVEYLEEFISTTAIFYLSH